MYNKCSTLIYNVLYKYYGLISNITTTSVRGENKRMERIDINQKWERKRNKQCGLMYVVEVWHLVEQKEHVKAGNVLLLLI